ncbi:MAG: 30S ribosome-binding factor RbfA [Desulfobacterales bacterium]
MRPYSRADRVGELIRQILAETLLKTIKDPRIKTVVITDVKMSSDLRNAKIYFALSGNKDRIKQAAEGFQQASGYLKRVLGQELTLRYMPNLSFFYDNSFDYGARIEELLKLAKIDDGPNHFPVKE